MKTVLLDALTISNGDIDFNVFRDFGEIVCYDLTTPDEIVPRLKDADAVLINKVELTADILSQLPSLKYVGIFATGYNNVDVKYAKEHGITVCNAGSYSTNAVAQQVFAFILHHASNTAAYDKFVKEGGWVYSKRFSPFDFPLNEISGKTLGIFGYGSIGSTVAKIANAFGMNVLVATRTPKCDDTVKFVSFDEMLENSDYVTVHCPLTEQTKELFNAETFKKFKDGAYFINTARGGVMDEKALFDALESGKLSGAGIDVLTHEPMAADCPLLKAKNITITPHIAWAPLETRQRLLKIVYDNIAAYLDGNPVNVVSK